MNIKSNTQNKASMSVDYCAQSLGHSKSALYRLGDFINQNSMGEHELNIANNALEGDSIVRLFDNISRNDFIEDLDISDNVLCAPGCIVLATVLHKITYLQRLNVSSNVLTSPGASVFLQVLPRSAPHLTALMLEQNQLCGKAFASIVDYLAKAPRLERLNLSRNDFSMGAHGFFWETIAVHPRLNYLSMERCGLTESAAHAIADALSCNNVLRILTLGGNMLRMNGVCAVMAAVVGRNASLLKLSLNENQVLVFCTRNLLRAKISRPSAYFYTTD